MEAFIALLGHEIIMNYRKLQQLERSRTTGIETLQQLEKCRCKGNTIRMK
jgi:hypothetical protein